MLLGNDFESSALGFGLDHEPGGFYNVSPANTQLAAVIVERVTGMPYETYVDQRLWRAAGRGHRGAAARPARRHAGRTLLLARDGARHAARPRTCSAATESDGQHAVLPARLGAARWRAPRA